MQELCILYEHKIQATVVKSISEKLVSENVKDSQML
jgi:hypothetical protein